jgi:hypothetical protein
MPTVMQQRETLQLGDAPAVPRLADQGGGRYDIEVEGWDGN